MRKFAFLIAATLFLAVPLMPAHAIQCVAFARAVSGIQLSGDAWEWWSNAAGTYDRGATPGKGAVLVFARQGHMQHGHVSVVTKVVNSRLVLVDHANWAPAQGAGRGEVAHAVPVLDVSPRNDWTQVRVWYRPAGQYGNRVYSTKGFVYSQRAAGGRVESASFKAAASHAAGDRARSHPSTIGLIKVGNHTFRHRHPAAPTPASAPHRPRQIAECAFQPWVFENRQG